MNEEKDAFEWHSRSLSAYMRDWGIGCAILCFCAFLLRDMIFSLPLFAKLVLFLLFFAGAFGLYAVWCKKVRARIRDLRNLVKDSPTGRKKFVWLKNDACVFSAGFLIAVFLMLFISFIICRIKYGDWFTSSALSVLVFFSCLFFYFLSSTSRVFLEAMENFCRAQDLSRKVLADMQKLSSMDYLEFIPSGDENAVDFEFSIDELQRSFMEAASKRGIVVSAAAMLYKPAFFDEFCGLAAQYCDLLCEECPDIWSDFNCKEVSQKHKNDLLNYWGECINAGVLFERFCFEKCDDGRYKVKDSFSYMDFGSVISAWHSVDFYDGLDSLLIEFVGEDITFDERNAFVNDIANIATSGLRRVVRENRYDDFSVCIGVITTSVILFGRNLARTQIFKERLSDVDAETFGEMLQNIMSKR